MRKCHCCGCAKAGGKQLQGGRLLVAPRGGLGLAPWPRCATLFTLSAAVVGVDVSRKFKGVAERFNREQTLGRELNTQLPLPSFSNLITTVSSDPGAFR